MFAGIRTGSQLAVDCGLCEHSGISDHDIDSIDALVEVVLDFIEIAVVGIGDFWRDVAFRNSVHIFSSDVQRADDGI